MHTILLGLRIGGPRRNEGDTRRTDVAFFCTHDSSSFSPPLPKKSSSKSEVKSDASTRVPSCKSTPGFSCPGSPKRINFIHRSPRYCVVLDSAILTELCHPERSEGPMQSSDVSKPARLAMPYSPHQRAYYRHNQLQFALT